MEEAGLDSMFRSVDTKDGPPPALKSVLKSEMGNKGNV